MSPLRRDAKRVRARRRGGLGFLAAERSGVARVLKMMKGLWNFGEFFLETGCAAGFLWTFKLLNQLALSG